MTHPSWRSLLALAIPAFALLLPNASQSQSVEVMTLGRSSSSGAVCQAVRDYDDPAAQARDARAWRVICRGYRAALGRIYILPEGESASWRTALESRASCDTPEAANLAGLRDSSRAACRAGEGRTPYVVYQANRGRNHGVAEGYAPIADILETGLRVVTGAAKAPKMIEVQSSRAQAEIAADFPDIGGLAAAEAAAAVDPTRLRTRAYVQNNEWQFEEAEAAFRAIATEAEAQNAAPASRADALLNLALNISNNGRFDEADAFFKEAEPFVAQTSNPVLRSRALNYRALHARNRGRLDDAIVLARQALQARDLIRQTTPAVAVGPVVQAEGGIINISADVARGLNAGRGALDLVSSRVTPADELAVQDAQAHQLIGSILAEKGDLPGARAEILQAKRILADRTSAGFVSVWLMSRVEADLANVELASGAPAAAVAGYQAALGLLRTRHAGSVAEGALLLDLGNAQSLAGRRQDALLSFGAALSIFNAQRGGYGASVDAAQPYFDLLLDLIRIDPGKAAAYSAQFFEASEAAVGSATARTVTLLAARVAAGDTTTAGLARALEDLRGELLAAERRVALLQLQSGQAAEREAADSELRNLQRQVDALEAELFAVNPRYNQLIKAGISTADLQQVLKPDEVYLKILVLAGRTYGVLVTPKAVTPYAIALTRDQVNAAVKILRAPFDAKDVLPGFDVAASATLFDQLAGPVKAELLGARHIIYEPDGALIALPMATFVTDHQSVALLQSRQRPGAQVDYRGVSWLGSKVGSSLVVSGASFLQSRKFAPSRAKQTYIGFGDPVLPRTESRAFSNLVSASGRRFATAEAVCGRTRTALLQIDALPETAAEVRAVGGSLRSTNAIVLGRDFNDGDIKTRRDLADYRVLYFATHSLLPQPDACLPQPALVTSLGDAGSDALLEASEIVDLKLDADLVVLAACDTGGAGADGAAGEALGGLTRAMIYAGTRGLVVSHWAVDSAAAARTMTRMFEAGAATQAEALRQAQAALQADPSSSHPYFWAPFTVVGDGDRALPGS